MRTSQFPLQTVKETPADAEVVSHQLMLRAGLIRKLAAGLYTWLPLGLRVLRKVERIVREEMERAGALEVLMPAVQPAELWQESGRWEQYGPELLRLKDRHHREFCFGPTHEEIITDLARTELKSYKQLPVNFYQIQTKFRDEIRPRFGVMRAREFLMKDAYSFHADDDSLAATYQVMHADLHAHLHPLRARLPPRAGRHRQHRRQRLPRVPRAGRRRRGRHRLLLHRRLRRQRRTGRGPGPGGNAGRRPTQDCRLVDTPQARTIADLVEQFGLPDRAHRQDPGGGRGRGQSRAVWWPCWCAATMNSTPSRPPSCPRWPPRCAWRARLRSAPPSGAGPGSLGPKDLPIPCIVDRAVAVAADFSAGANQDGKHWFGLNWGRDLPLPEVADLRNVVDGDPSPDGQGTLRIARGIEVGSHLPAGTQVQRSPEGHRPGRGRQGPDHDHGLLRHRRVPSGGRRHRAAPRRARHLLAQPHRPLQVALLPMKLGKSYRVREATEQLYAGPARPPGSRSCSTTGTPAPASCSPTWN